MAELQNRHLRRMREAEQREYVIHRCPHCDSLVRTVFEHHTIGIRQKVKCTNCGKAYRTIMEADRFVTVLR